MTINHNGKRIQTKVRPFFPRASNASIWVVSIAGVLGSVQILPNSLLVGTILLSVVYELLRKIDLVVPLPHIAGLIAIVQWLVGPILSYNSERVVSRYYMHVAESEYFAYALPATAAFIVGLFVVRSTASQRRILAMGNSADWFRVGIALGVVGSIFGVLGPFVPLSLAFAFFLLSQLKYVGVLYLMNTTRPFRWAIIVILVLPLYIKTSETAMFHSLILWGGLLSCFLIALRRRRWSQKIAITLIGAICVLTIQAVKETYRSRLLAGEKVSLVGEVSHVLADPDVFTSDYFVDHLIVRMNQGWIVSAVMKNVPSNEPYAKGDTLIDALIASAVPRFLYDGKAESGGQANFQRFTGYGLGEGTSMAISPLGEAYANFGCAAGILLMLVYGLAFSFGFRACIKYATRHPDFVFWIPFIFFQALKAETEFVTIFNQFSKGSIIAFAIHWIVSLHMGHVGHVNSKQNGRSATVIRRGRRIRGSRFSQPRI